jgi:hypothetical protein
MAAEILIERNGTQWAAHLKGNADVVAEHRLLGINRLLVSSYTNKLSGSIVNNEVHRLKPTEPRANHIYEELLFLYWIAQLFSYTLGIIL